MEGTTWTRDGIFEEVRSAISKQSDDNPNMESIDVEEIVPTAELVTTLGFDSLDLVEIFMALENKFEFIIPDEDYDRLKSVQDVVDYIEGKLG